MTTLNSGPALSAEAVAAYLMAQPDFFVLHPELLVSLRLPHDSGEAVSLVARQIDLLRAKGDRLSAQMEHLLQIARENDGLNHRLHQLTLTLFDAQSLEDVLASLDWGLHQLFEAEFVGVRLLEPKGSSPVRTLFVEKDHPLHEWARAEIDSDQVRCGIPEESVASFLFGSDADQVGSHVMVRLHRAGLRGLLAIGSRDAQRFSADMGSVFLRQLAEILSARMAPLVLTDT